MTMRVVVTGVSGTGKSEVGRRLAAMLALPFHDADDHHSAASIAKMAAGTPLTDADRAAWLDALAALLAREPAMVLACSALKRSYRARLAAAVSSPPHFVFLHGSFDTIRARLAARQGHYFAGDDMLRSQFDALEVPDPREVAHVDIDAPVDSVVAACRRALHGG